MMPLIVALQYICNAGDPRVNDFIDDHEPIGKAMLQMMMDRGYVKLLDERIFLTESGKNCLGEVKT